MKHESVLGLSMIKNDELPVWINVLSKESIDEDGTIYPEITDPEQVSDCLNQRRFPDGRRIFFWYLYRLAKYPFDPFTKTKFLV